LNACKRKVKESSHLVMKARAKYIHFWGIVSVKHAWEKKGRGIQIEGGGVIFLSGEVRKEDFFNHTVCE